MALLEMSMNSQEFADNYPTITREKAQRIAQSHGFAWADIVAALGDHATYKTAQLLAWMGY